MVIAHFIFMEKPTLFFFSNFMRVIMDSIIMTLQCIRDFFLQLLNAHFVFTDMPSFSFFTNFVINPLPHRDTF